MHAPSEYCPQMGCSRIYGRERAVARDAVDHTTAHVIPAAAVAIG